MIRAFNWGQLLDSIVHSAAFIPQTLILTFVPFAISLMLGGVVAVVRIWRVPVVARLLQFLVTVMKGVPTYLLLVTGSLLFTLYFNRIAQYCGWSVRQQNIDPIVLGVVIISIASIPMMSETVRGAVISVPEDQLEAGYAAGLTHAQIMRRIILPQAIPEAIPVLTNNLVSMVKASALCSLVGVSEVLSVAIRSSSERYDLLEGYIAAALVYWALCFVIEKGMKAIEVYSGRFKLAIAA